MVQESEAAHIYICIYIIYTHIRILLDVPESLLLMLVKDRLFIIKALGIHMQVRWTK